MGKKARKLSNWELLKEEDISPSRWFPLYKHTVKLPTGKIIDDYYISKLGDVAMIVAVTKQNEIVFVRQYKHGPRKIILELPAGRVDNHSPKEAAKRELNEETGYDANNLVLLGTLIHAPSKDPEIDYGFITIGITRQGNQKLEETEDIEVVLIPCKDIEKMILSGKICASETVAFLSLAKLKYPELFI